MADELYTTLDVPEVEDDNDRYDKEYRRSLKWDIELGDFARDGSKKIVEDTGERAYMIWCYKICQTERFACLAYPDEIGVEIERATYDKDHGTVESMLERTITEALMTNPRTEDVSDFSFVWDGETVTGSFKISAVNMEDFIMTI